MAPPENLIFRLFGPQTVDSPQGVDLSLLGLFLFLPVLDHRFDLFLLRL